MILNEKINSFITNNFLDKDNNNNNNNIENFFDNIYLHDKIKYYKSSLVDGKYKKISNFQNYKEEDSFKVLFEGDRISNILIEICLN